MDTLQDDYTKLLYGLMPPGPAWSDTLPGTYVALSGGPDVEFYNRGLVSLFVRIA